MVAHIPKKIVALGESTSSYAPIFRKKSDAIGNKARSSAFRSRMNRRRLTTVRLACRTVHPRPCPFLSGLEQGKKRIAQRESSDDQGQVERVIDRDEPVDVQRIIDVQIVMWPPRHCKPCQRDIHDAGSPR